MKLFEFKKTVIVRQEPPMNEEAMVNAVAGISLAHPAMQAVLQMIEEQIEDGVDFVAKPETALKPQLLAHGAGGVEQLQMLRARIYDYAGRKRKMVEG